MKRPDLNQLATLDVLLSEGSVARAAARLRLSPSAMSRSLARLRQALGDPLLVKAGRGLVPTPRAIALTADVHRLVQEAEAVLRPQTDVNLREVERTVTLRTSDGFAETFGPALIQTIAEEAPGIRLHFVQKPEKDSRGLREGRVDLETGVVDPEVGPELRARALFDDRLVVAVRAGHPLASVPMGAAAYLQAAHVAVSRSGADADAVDRPFLPADIPRKVAAVVSGFSAALALARRSDLVATVPDRHTAALRDGMMTSPAPFASRPFTVSMIWHPRMDADPMHRWLRRRVREICDARRAD